MPQPTIFIILRVTCTDAYSHTALPYLQTPTQPRSAPHDHEVENLRRVRPQCLNLSLQAIGCWRWFPASLLEPRFLFKKNSFLATTAHLAARPRLTPLPTPARSCRTPSIRKASFWFHQKRSASRALPLLQKAGAEVLCRRVPAPPHLPHAPQAPRRGGGGGRRHGQRGREGLQGHRRPQPR